MYGDDDVVSSIIEAKVMLDLSHTSQEQQRDEMKYKFDADIDPSAEVADIFAGASEMSAASSSWQPMIKLPSNGSVASVEDAPAKGKGKNKGKKEKQGQLVRIWLLRLHWTTMPTDVWEAAKFIRPRLLSKLGDAKLWPVKLSAYKHQDSLRPLDMLMCAREVVPDDQIDAANRLAVHRMELYDEDHFTPTNVTKQKKEKTEKTGKGNALED
ncbi:unnamed protein product [Symbiodinium sp. CCMP2592]|nr:unnamed protein product [Symbiodinium sp. CCMP2592]